MSLKYEIVDGKIIDSSGNEIKGNVSVNDLYYNSNQIKEIYLNGNKCNFVGLDKNKRFYLVLGEIKNKGIGYLKYTMFKLYPDTYRTMTEIPNELLNEDGSIDLITDSLQEVFQFCSNITTVPKINNTKKSISMSDMFCGCRSLTSIDTSNWDTSNVTSLYSTFSNCGVKALDVSKWNTSNVTSMGGVFSGNGATSNLTSLDLSNWDTSKVTNMSEMFQYAKLIDIGDTSNWDTSKVTNMNGMFQGCGIKNIENIIKNFDTSNVTDMGRMFFEISQDFNLSNFDTHKVTNMSNMFGFSDHISLNLSYLNVDNVVNMMGMFDNCKIVDLNITGWNTNKVIYMSYMFARIRGIDNLNDVLKIINTDNLEKSDYMFSNATTPSTLTLSSWNTSKLKSMIKMFGTYWGYDSGCTSTIIDITGWDTSNVTNMMCAFSNCLNLTTIIGIIDMKSCTNYQDMFKGSTKLTGVKLKNVPSDFDASKAGLSEGQYTIVS